MGKEQRGAIHHFWLSRHDYVPAKKLFKVLKRKVTKAEARNFLDDLSSDANIYRLINEPAFVKWKKEEATLRRSLEALQTFHVQQQTPCVLSLMRAYRSSLIKLKRRDEALSAIERFHFLFTAITSQHSPGGISAMYAALGRRIFNSADAAARVVVIRDLRQRLRERLPAMEEVVAAFPRVIYTDRISKQRRLTMTI